MDQKLPYYMTYPTVDIFHEDKRSRRDLEYMRSLYPGVAREMIPIIEEACDDLEYEGSLMYDEYPDKLMLRLMCSRVYDKGKEYFHAQAIDFEDAESKWLRAMVDILIYEEFCNRRERKRRKKNIWY